MAMVGMNHKTIDGLKKFGVLKKMATENYM